MYAIETWDAIHETHGPRVISLTLLKVVDCNFVDDLLRNSYPQREIPPNITKLLT